jgi:hypothetical protein
LKFRIFEAFSSIFALFHFGSSLEWVWFGESLMLEDFGP